MRDFRFGVNLLGTGYDFLERVRAADAAGVDVLMVPDHLGIIAPFPALTAAGQVTSRMRLGNFVLNAGFYSPALLARDCATTDRLTGGRLEIGLGAGYVADEFEAAGLEFPSAGKRVRHLAATVEYLRTSLADEAYSPAPIQSPPPIMVAGVGDKVLTLAAEHADIVALASVPDEDTLADRVAFLRSAAGDRFDELELNLIVFAFAVDRDPDFEGLRRFQPDATDEQLRASMNTLCGTFDEVVAKVKRLRADHGVSYFTVIEPDAAALEDLSRVIAAVR
ncbi:TIGR03621 family F420-dependent LLM class oxidoreductase [Tsukamurella sp. 8F]|uniref:TIGR03621 family F420-dependent LLM class oxidoreductase n=1 Tax=unclassified Tsukamurella TaxID=2633480 RepID=UPI0023B9C2EC|nr:MULTISPECIES: TIGR03621 family F420-dependent LLM class oxidoreductase [unclassified Tsukamurella]MDF0531591.1 TIGR03621 family F420-dependent LLM class oxidoreductase [Tsukamurella sp. 8J]MDF0587562.1 TIGR03621 family F420-dependent LLM class oxidoreductase [Tsukamurella sp. 8F]